MDRSAASMDSISADREWWADESGDATPSILVDEPVDEALPAGSTVERSAHSNRCDRLLLRTEQRQQHVWSSARSTAPSASARRSDAVHPVSSPRAVSHSRPPSPRTCDSPASSPAPAAPSRGVSSGASTPILPSIGSHPYNLNNEQGFLEDAAAAGRDSTLALQAEWDRYRTGGAPRERELERALPPFLTEHSQREQQPSRQSQQREYDQRECEFEPDGHSAPPTAPAAGVRATAAGVPSTSTGGGRIPSDGPVTLGERQRPIRAGFERAEQYEHDEYRTTATHPGTQQLRSLRGAEHDGPRSPVRNDARGRVELVGTGTRNVYGSNNREPEYDGQRGDGEWGDAVQRSVDGPDDNPNRTPRERVHALRSFTEPADGRPDGQHVVHAAGSPPIATLESPSPTSLSPSESSAVLSTGAGHSQLVSSAGRSSAATPSPTDANATSSSPPTLSAARLPVASSDGPSQARGQQLQQQRQHVGVAFGHSSRTPPYRTQRERDASYSSQPSSSVAQRAPSPSSAASSAISTASAVPV